MLYFHLFCGFIVFYQIIVVAHILVHNPIQPHPSVFVLAVHVALLKVHSRDILPSQPNDNHILSENGIRVLFLYDRNNEVFVALLLTIAANRSNPLLFLLGEGINKYVREQIAKLVGYDVVLLWWHELNHSFFAGLSNYHFYVLSDDKHFVAIFNNHSGHSEDLFGQNMGQSHTSNVIHIYLLNKVKTTQIGEVSTFVFLLDQNLHAAGINNIPFELLL